MNTSILLTVTNNRYEYAGDVTETREAVEGARSRDEFLAVSDIHGGAPFFVNPEQVVSIYPKKED